MSPSPRSQPTGERFDLRVRDLRFEADGVLSIGLERPDREPLAAWRPGAHLDVRFGNGVERQYSLCSDPADRFEWRVAVLREETSRGGSQYVHDSLRPGDLVSVGSPINTFVQASAARYLFIAGGIGITPLLPMIQEAEASGARWSLAYLGREEERMAFRTHPLVAGGDVQIFARDRGARIDLASWIGAVDNAVVYACGPERLLQALEDLATEWPSGTLHLERFQAKTLAEPLSADAFEVECRRSGVSLTVESGCSILEMLEAAGIGVPSSCLEGVCGTCETPLIDGEAEHRDSILSPDEREAQDTMMVCVSRALTSHLVLDI